ncbi:MAG: endolytic transglycosylase MltG [Burkholderiales bacterium]|nr:endolytic transglycosylase MltG [Burkholderiales bacterium]
MASAAAVNRIFRLFLLLLVAGASAAGWLAWKAYTEPLAVPAATLAFEVRPGSSLATVARELGAAGVLPYPIALVALARVRGLDRGIKAGSYEIEAGTTLPGLLAKLTQGDVTQTSLVIVEGATFGDVKRVLRGNPDVKNTILDLADSEIMAKLGATGPPEGRFFPDTYFFAAGSTDLAILQRARRAMDARLASAWEQRAGDLPFATPYEALIVASIVEKETGKAVDRPLIASVFVNRLRKNMRLQSDPTVIYGMGTRFDGDLRRRDLEADTPFNTYTREGLPPTPIALPSQAALDATLNPPATDYLYFVARGDGTSKFSSSLADHNRAVSRFQKGGK